MTWKEALVAGFLIAIPFGSVVYNHHQGAMAKRNLVAANLARLNVKYGFEGKSELYSQYVASGRLIGRNEAELRELLGEPSEGFSGCDFSESRVWFISAREGDRTRDPYASDFFVKVLEVEWSDGRQTVKIREDHYPKTQETASAK